jgi:hypothetical protein
VELHRFKLPNYQLGVIVGLLLSDGWLYYASANYKYPRFGLEQAFSQSYYVWSVLGILYYYCYSLPRFKTKNRNNIQTSSVTFATRSMPCLVEVFKDFYLLGKKVVPENIYHRLAPVSLAHVIMGDGTAVYGGISICTYSFTVKDVVRLIYGLIIKYRLKCTLHMSDNKPRIFISSKSMDLLTSIINPYIIPSMKYILLTQYSISSQIKKVREFAPLQDISATRAICIKNLPFTAVFCYTEPLKEICIKHAIPTYLYSIFIGLLLSEG